MKKSILKNLSNTYFHKVEMVEKHLGMNAYQISVPIAISLRIRLKKHIYKVSFRLKLFLILCIHFFSKPLLHVVRQNVLIKEKVGPKKYKMIKAVVVKCAFVLHIAKQKVEDTFISLFLTSQKRGVIRLANLKSITYDQSYIDGRFIVYLKHFTGLGKLLGKLNKKRLKHSRKSKKVAFHGRCLLSVKMAAFKQCFASSYGLFAHAPASWHRNNRILIKKEAAVSAQ